MIPLSFFSYVNRRGWQHYFKTYCIPEDLVPRILSPAYFHHYHSQPLAKPIPSVTEKLKEKEGEQQLVLGMGPVQHSLWRLSRLVPLEAIQRQFNKYKGRQSETPSIDDVLAATQSLEIQEGSDGVSLKPFLEKDTVPPSNLSATEKSDGRSTPMSGNGGGWLRVPSLPSYVPFGQVFIDRFPISSCAFICDKNLHAFLSLYSTFSRCLLSVFGMTAICVIVEIRVIWNEIDFVLQNNNG